MDNLNRIVLTALLLFMFVALTARHISIENKIDKCIELIKNKNAEESS